MAYDSNNLSAMSYANGFTFWHYRERDENSVPWRPGYFDDAASMLRPGDLICVSEPVPNKLPDGTVVDTDLGALAMVREIKPHVVLRRIG